MILHQANVNEASSQIASKEKEDNPKTIKIAENIEVLPVDVYFKWTDPSDQW